MAWASSPTACRQVRWRVLVGCGLRQAIQSRDAPLADTLPGNFKRQQFRAMPEPLRQLPRSPAGGVSAPLFPQGAADVSGSHTRASLCTQSIFLLMVFAPPGVCREACTSARRARPKTWLLRCWAGRL